MDHGAGRTTAWSRHAEARGSCLALSAYAVKLTWLERRKGLKDRGDERLEVHHPIGAGQDEKYPEG